jgi:citrate lyase beta subunit
MPFERSWMFVPGNRQRFLDKALFETKPDVALLDLEEKAAGERHD